MAGSRRLSALSAGVLARVEQHLPQGSLVVALSGGADSAVCAWAANRLRPEVRAVHIDHNWPASATLRSAALTIAGKLGLHISVIETKVREGASPEGQARLARYDALEREVAPDEWLVTGHTQDDQAETVLGNLLRGAGSTGLMGIPQHRGNIIRPLLGITRSETRELAALLGLPWADDPSNLDTALRRNALRRDIIPYLETRMNPALRASLVRLAAAANQDEWFFDDAASAVPIQIDGSTVWLPAPCLVTGSRPVAVRAIRHALRHVSSGYPGSAADVATIISVAEGGPPVQLAGRVRVERNGVWVSLEGAVAEMGFPAGRWPVPGRILAGPWTFDAWIEETPPIAFSLSHYAEVFDADVLGESLEVRSMDRDDRVAIVGGSKSVAEVLAEAQIPSNRRSNWPVVVADGDVIWVPGARRANVGWVGSATNRYLWVRATVEGNP
jgi:tRNA(Ile)-lysidine synthase